MIQVDGTTQKDPAPIPVVVDASELAYLDGLSGNIQTQLDGKAATSHTHAASAITSGTLALANGGTGADLSATGGAGKFLKQATTGAAVTVASVTLSDLAAGTLAVTLTFGSSGTAANSRSITGISTGVSYDTVTGTSLQMRVNATRIGGFGLNVSGNQADTNFHIGGLSSNYISNTAGTGVLGNVLNGNYWGLGVAGSNNLYVGKDYDGNQVNAAFALGAGGTTRIGYRSSGDITYAVPSNKAHRFIVNATYPLILGSDGSTAGDYNFLIGVPGSSNYIANNTSYLNYVAATGLFHRVVVGAQINAQFGKSQDGTAGDENWTIGVTNYISNKSTTGIKIAGNLGLFGVTPIARPTTAIASASFTANSGTAVNDASTFGGYTLKQVVQALQSIGILT